MSPRSALSRQHSPLPGSLAFLAHHLMPTPIQKINALDLEIHFLRHTGVQSVGSCSVHKSEHSHCPHEPSVVKGGVSDRDALSQMEFLEQTASSRVATVNVTGRGEARPHQSLSVQVCSLGFPGAGSLNARAVCVSDDLCSTSAPLSVEKRKWIAHTGKGLPPCVCLCLSIHLIGVVQNLRCQ